MLNLIPRKKNQPSGRNPSDPSDVNDSIDLFGNDLKPDHNLKISSIHATNDINNPGKNQSKRKIPRPNSKATLEGVVGNKGLPEENQSNDPTGNESNTEKNSWKGKLIIPSVHLLMSQKKMSTMKKWIHYLLNWMSSLQK
jgi:hypothetical protein